MLLWLVNIFCQLVKLGNVFKNFFWVLVQNEYSDDDEEPDFSSNEDNDDRLDRYKRNYHGKRSNYSKMGLSQGDGDPDDTNLVKNEGDSDSELENFGGETKKGARAKFNRVQLENYFFLELLFLI